MQKLVATILLGLSLPASSSAARAGGPFPRLVPPPEDFRLTLREQPHSEIPLGPSCGGEASLALLCRAFSLTLENASKHTVHISELRCFEPDVVFEIRQPKSSSGWWPISQPGKPTCKTLDWVNIRLKPGEKTEYITRLISPRRSIDALSVGSYTLHAHWALFGCTEASEGTDCLSPLQVIRGASTVADVAFQEPVTVFSNEVTAQSPPLPDLDNLKFAFEVATASGETPNAKTDASFACVEASNTGLDCTVFQYSIRNLGDRPVRNGTFSCSDSDITPEYRLASRDWKRVPSIFWDCFRNVFVETVILPGEAVTGTFRLSTLSPGYDTKTLLVPGEYHFRFTFTAKACIASPDGAFCLVRPAKQPSIVSSDVTVQVPALRAALELSR